MMSGLKKTFLASLARQLYSFYSTNSCEYMSLKIEEMKKCQKLFCEGGGEKSQLNLAKKGKIYVNDKLSKLFDNGFYIETGHFIGYGQSYGNIPRAGCVTGFGKIKNRLCAVIASDPTVKAGTVYPIQLRKQMRIFELVTYLKLPLVFIIDSGGAFLPLQAEIFADKEYGGRTFYNEAYLQSLGLDVITLVCGSCTAGGAYIPTMSSETGMVSGTSHIFLGGPPLVKAAIGEVLSAEELGGATLHTTISGCADYKYENEEEGIESIRSIISTLPQQKQRKIHRDISEIPNENSDVNLNQIVINMIDILEDRKVTMLQIISNVLDANSFNEFKKGFGNRSICGYGKIDGYTVGIIGVFDELNEKDCIKLSHFVQICSFRQITIVSLLHFMQSNNQPHDEHVDSLILKHKSSLLRSLATRKVPLFTLVVGDCIGDDYYVLGGESVRSEMILAWPNARFGYCENNEEHSTNTYHSALSVAGNMVVDQLIEPNQTRKVLLEFLNIFSTESNILINVTSDKPVYRF